MTDAAPHSRPGLRWLWWTGLLVAVALAVFWLGAPWQTGPKTGSAQPVAKSTNWAIEPTGPAVPVNLPKTEMTNAPDTSVPSGKAP